MKIGVISSDLENIQLFKILNKYNHNYQILLDQNNGPYNHKSFEHNLKNIENNIKTLKSKGVDKIIVSPIYELHFQNQNKHQDITLPLFKKYLLNYCFKYSLVGKLGFVGGLDAISQIEKLIKPLQDQYSLTDNQKKISKFHQPFATRCKETVLWNDLLKSISPNHWMANKIIKTDLKYFKDANVDTLIPLSYGYLAYDKTLNSHLNFKKIRYHNKEKLAKTINDLLEKNENKDYKVSIYSNGTTYFIDQKKRKWLLAKGKEIQIKKESL